MHQRYSLGFVQWMHFPHGLLKQLAMTYRFVEFVTLH